MVPSVPPPLARLTTTVATPKAADWESFFTRLVDFYLDHGHCEVTDRAAQQRSLRQWVNQQRAELAAGRLSLEHRLKLSAIGFPGKFTDLPAGDQVWERHFTELLTFHNRHHHFCIPHQDANYQELRAWFQVQRRDHLAGRLPAHREQRFKAAGLFRERRGPQYDWTLRDAVGWEPMFAALRTFRQAHGHFNVPAGLHGNPGGEDLKSWVRRQRRLQRLGRLPPKLEQSLAMIGFDWVNSGHNQEDLWSGRQAELAAYQKQTGHCRVPVPWPENPKLGQWVRRQRAHWKKGKLSRQQIARLDALGFDWHLPSKSDGNWNTRLAELAAYQKQTGHCRVPWPWPEHPKLAQWVRLQRAHRRKKTLSPKNIARLDALGFDWDYPQKKEKTWNAHFAKLAAYHKQTGHCLVPVPWPENPKLARWVCRQRAHGKKGKLSPPQIARLDALGFDWHLPSKSDGNWNTRLADLAAYQKRTGHCCLPVVWPENPGLASWVQHQRVRLQQAKLPPGQKSRLDVLGFVWDASPHSDEAWNAHFAALADHRKQTGHCRVPVPWPENPKLAQWVRRQRAGRRHGILSPKHIAQLDALGFVWDASPNPDEAWSARYADLAAYQKQTGHCRVPVPWPQNPKLARWVRIQRARHKEAKLPPGQVSRLDALGFDWDDSQTKEETWNAHFAELAAYQEQTGHCHVPVFWSENLALAGWLDLQRSLRRSRKLAPECIAQLNALGFYWGSEQEPHESWDAHFTQLAAYHRQFGHCREPLAWPENAALAAWIRFQRAARGKKKLSPVRRRRLEALGFDWSAAPKPATEWDRRFAELLEFRRRFGHSQVPLPWPGQPALGLWVQAQRAQQQAGTLAPEHRARLDKIKFLWTAGWGALGKNWERKQKALRRHLFRKPGPPAVAAGNENG